MAEFQCRTCLKISDSESSFPIEQRLLGRPIKEIILVHVPEMISSSLVKNIICSSCYQVIKTFAHFIERCKEVESTLRRINSEIKESKFNSHDVQKQNYSYNSKGKENEQHLQTKPEQGLLKLKDNSFFDSKKMIRTYSSKTNRLLSATKVTTIEENIQVKPEPVVPEPLDVMKPHQPSGSAGSKIMAGDSDIFWTADGETYQLKSIGTNFKLPVLDSLDHYEMKPHDRAITIPQPTDNFSQLLNGFAENDIQVLQVDLSSSRFSNRRKKRMLLFGSVITQCHECDARFDDHREFEIHFEDLHKNGLPLPNPEKEMFDTFITTTRKRAVNICPVCEKNFSTLRMLEQHLGRAHKDYMPYKCEKCNKTFRIKRNYQNHLKIFSSYECCNYRKCQYCSEMINRNKARDHIKLHRIYKCDQCGQSFTTPANLRLHRIRHQNSGTKEMHLCPVCGKIFARASYLRNHSAIHEEPHNRYMCDKCAKVYSTKARLKSHMKRVHTAKKQHECPECKKKCSTLSAVRCHLKLKHWNVQSHTCPICDEKFTRGDYFRRHMKQHTNDGEPTHNRAINTDRPNRGKRIYSRVKFNSARCKICSKLYKDVHTLRLHVLVSHVNTMRYRCKFCSLTFSNVNNRYRHEKRHNDPNFEMSCKICWRRMDTKEQLDAHYAKHKKNRKYKCGKCGELLSSKYFLRHHITEKHVSKEDIEREKATVLKDALEEFLIMD